MKRVMIIFAGLVFLLFLSALLFAQVSLYEDSYNAWDVGDYVKALKGFKTILESPGWERYFDNIALITGELYRVDEVTVDGRNVAISKNGKYGSYRTTDVRTTVTHIVSFGAHITEAAAIQSGNVIFSPRFDRIAYLAVKETDEIKKLRSEAAAQQQTAAAQPPAGQRGGRAANPQLVWEEAKNTRIVVRDLVTKNEQWLETGNLVIISAAYSSDGTQIYFTAGELGNTAVCDIYAIPESGGAARKVTQGPGFKTNPIAIEGGVFLLYSPTSRNPIPQPPTGQQEPAPVAPQPQRGRGGASAPPEFAVLNLSTGAVKTFPANTFTAAAGGSAIVYTLRQGEQQTIGVIELSGELTPKTVYSPAAALNAVRISPNGKTVVFSMMTKDDYEVYTIDSDSTNPIRISREIQHDRSPQFITNDMVLYVKGEPRHQRTYVYNITTGSTIKLFHNNTIRTIVPEYEWVANYDGTKLLIVAERDGNTITPERGVYLMDLSRKITREELLKRMDANLQAETDLRERGERMFKPIFNEVKAVVDNISIARIFEYEKTLYDFDSKNVSRPGNKLAIDYLEKMYRSFGYDVELQWFETSGTRTANVLATLKGTENPELIYVLSAHFDSNGNCAGADDNTSSTVGLLEAARVLKNHPMPATIIIASFTGEESGLLGSREFVRQTVDNKLNLVGAVNNDMVGWSENHRLDNTIRYSNAGIRDVEHAGAFLFTKLITYDAVYYKGTDAAAYYSAYGDIVGGIGSYPVLGSPYYHQPTDRLEYINHELVTETSKATTAAMMLLASSPSRLKDVTVANRSGDTADITWTQAPEKGITHYIVAYGPPDAPMKNTLQTKEPKIQLKNVGKGTVVAVKAVNSRGLEGWDWARITIDK